MRIDVLTLFPNMFRPVTEESILGRAAENGILDIRLTNIRDYTLDKHNKTDDYPFGGGAGMVMYAEPIFRSLEAVGAEGKRVLYMSPRGKMLDQQMIEELSREDSLVILCGHYEGVDQRALDHWNMEEVSIGDYVLTGGELPAMVLIDAVARLIPEVLGNSLAHLEESVYSGLLEYPQYTKPREFRGMEVPEILLSGHHRMIHLWQLEQSMRLTKERRPDLWQTYLDSAETLDKEEKKVLARVLSGEDE
ncbi:tRNA (guanosine(37)-N1)-methyltransferase TrmD [Bacilliculturomica massiliensis]|uniref:tRNA (guanosine(37)-N1)-methyltransferase TrmD n=1 Tax=Bacilliculturomica massiliensis TaxID=1917867 RepID=UPI00102F807B|nr:tRNA (guanosine(37)-N1)-methyltransferase TrmD [Bacilliculturomica massiliensis]